MISKLAIQLNNVFRYLIIFCICFIWINFYYTNFLTCVILSVVIATIFSFIFSTFINIKQEKKLSSASDIKTANLVISQLFLLNQTKQINYFFNVIKFASPNAKKVKLGVKVNNTIVVPMFNYELSVQDVLNCYKSFLNYHLGHLVILTHKLHPEVEPFLANYKNLNLQILTSASVYLNLIKPSNILPNKILEPVSKQKLTLKQILFVTLNKKNAKGYFFSGVIVLLSSLFYSYSLYYQIFGTILFALSLFSFYNVPFNIKSKFDIFK